MNDSGVIPRASRIMQAIATAGLEGARLTDLTEYTGLSRPTTHRILKDLAAEGLVSQDGESSRYRLGHELFLMALNAPSPDWDLPILRGIAQELADDVGDTVYISARELAGVRYLVRAEGSYPVRALMVEPGDVKPFTSSYSGLALLASTGAEAQSRALAAHLTDAPEGWWDEQHSDRQMRAQMEQVVRAGYCGGPGLVMPGVSGMAAPVLRNGALPLLAVSISAIDARLDDERIRELVPRLLHAARHIERLIAPRVATYSAKEKK